MLKGYYKNINLTYLILYIGFFMSDDYDKYLARLAPEKLDRIKRSVSKTVTGAYSAAPLVCLGPKKCPFINKCPIPDVSEAGELLVGDNSQYPIGRECIVEKYFIEQKMYEYMNHLEVSPENPVEMSIVNELALIDLYKNRCLNVLSQGDRRGEGRDFLLVDITGFNENGERAETTKLHPITDMIDKLEKRRDKSLEKFMATRKAKADYIARIGEKQNQSQLLSEIQRIREVLNASEQIKYIDQEVLLDD
jgi:hypothetical protein